MNIRDILKQAAPIMPVLNFTEEKTALRLIHSLVDQGLHVFEVTLRSDNALDILSAVRKIKGIMLGAGTVIYSEQLQAVADIGLDFAVSPGSSVALMAQAQSLNLPYLPGVATASDIQQSLNAGYEILKFFPAQASGGIEALKAFSGPFPQVQFCPTGGISEDNYQDYLALDSVCCVAGSWLAAQYSS